LKTANLSLESEELENPKDLQGNNKKIYTVYREIAHNDDNIAPLIKSGNGTGVY